MSCATLTPWSDCTESDVRPKTTEDEDYSIHRLLLGTHTSGQANDHLMIAEVLLPKANAESGKEITDMYDEEKQGASTDGSLRGPVTCER